MSDASLSLVHALRAADVLSPLDHELARMCARLDPVNAPWVALAAALCSCALADGHTCLDLDGPLLPQDADPSLLPAQDVDAWVAALQASPLVSDGALDTPIVLRERRLWLARYDHHERRLAEALVRVAAAPVRPVDPGVLDASVARLFAEGWANPRQEAAVRSASARALTVLAGGPGTGKTTTVVRLLAVLAEQAVAAGGDPPRVLLLAPTGKAAARLADAMRKQVSAVALAPTREADVRASLPTVASTVHRALGRSGRWLTRPQHDAERPWAADVVVLDEVSMVDLPLMARVLDAVKPGARLILLGDPDQLAAVGAGAVLSDLTSSDLPGAILDGVVHLVGSRRYREDSAVGRLARAVHAGDVTALRLGVDPDADWIAAPARPDRDAAVLARAVEGYTPYLTESDVAARLDAFDRYRVLCALRAGPGGVVALNSALEHALERAGLLRLDDVFYVGRPILITENDYGAKLFNGDVGIVGLDEDGARRVFFPDAGRDGGRPTVRMLAPARLPAHETAWATTVHKSQGSEFDRVLIVLPDAGHPLVTRELLYTAITRAKQGVLVVAPPGAVEASLPRRAVRRSGLLAALRRVVSAP
jgi:exodeoxyribonuclease V alpha subunit